MSFFIELNNYLNAWGRLSTKKTVNERRKKNEH